MKVPINLLIFILLTNLSCNSQSKNFIAKFHFASLDEAQKLITTEDVYTLGWSKFDIDAKGKTIDNNRQSLFALMADQMLSWQQDEIILVNNILDEVNKKIQSNGLVLNLPDKIYFIKSTLEEESGAAGYTRSNYIVLNDELIKGNSSVLEQLITHELFHVLSRNDPKLREALYEIIGFKMIKNITYPDSIKNRIISNPDAPLADSYIRLLRDQDTVDCVMILYSKSTYTQGAFFEYMNVGLLSLTDGDNKKPRLLNNKPIIYSIDEVSNFYEQVGKNTGYIINPEEVLADNFTFLLNQTKDLPSPWVVEQMQEVFSNNSKKAKKN